jgi:hypothetical protein
MRCQESGTHLLSQSIHHHCYKVTAPSSRQEATASHKVSAIGSENFRITCSKHKTKHILRKRQGAPIDNTNNSDRNRDEDYHIFQPITNNFLVGLLCLLPELSWLCSSGCHNLCGTAPCWPFSGLTPPRQQQLHFYVFSRGGPGPATKK